MTKCEHAKNGECDEYELKIGGKVLCRGNTAVCAGRDDEITQMRTGQKHIEIFKDNKKKTRSRYEVENHRLLVPNQDLGVLLFSIQNTLRNPPTKLHKKVEDILKKWARKLSMYPPTVK